jgi:hypothetical protein
LCSQSSRPKGGNGVVPIVISLGDVEENAGVFVSQSLVSAVKSFLQLQALVHAMDLFA